MKNSTRRALSSGRHRLSDHDDDLFLADIKVALEDSAFNLATINREPDDEDAIDRLLANSGFDNIKSTRTDPLMAFDDATFADGSTETICTDMQKETAFTVEPIFDDRLQVVVDNTASGLDANIGEAELAPTTDHVLITEPLNTKPSHIDVPDTPPYPEPIHEPPAEAEHGQSELFIQLLANQETLKIELRQYQNKVKLLAATSMAIGMSGLIAAVFFYQIIAELQTQTTKLATAAAIVQEGIARQEEATAK